MSTLNKEVRFLKKKFPQVVNTITFAPEIFQKTNQLNKMKKLTLLAAFAFVAAVSFSSCKKCVTCTLSAGTAYESSTELCDKKAERETFESACKSVGGTTKTK